VRLALLRALAATGLLAPGTAGKLGRLVDALWPLAAAFPPVSSSGGGTGLAPPLVLLIGLVGTLAHAGGDDHKRALCCAHGAHAQGSSHTPSSSSSSSSVTSASSAASSGVTGATGGTGGGGGGGGGSSAPPVVARRLVKLALSTGGGGFSASAVVAATLALVPLARVTEGRSLLLQHSAAPCLARVLNDGLGAPRAHGRRAAGAARCTAVLKLLVTASLFYDTRASLVACPQLSAFLAAAADLATGALTGTAIGVSSNGSSTLGGGGGGGAPGQRRALAAQSAAVRGAQPTERHARGAGGRANEPADPMASGAVVELLALLVRNLALQQPDEGAPGHTHHRPSATGATGTTTHAPTGLSLASHRGKRLVATPGLLRFLLAAIDPAHRQEGHGQQGLFAAGSSSARTIDLAREHGSRGDGGGLGQDAVASARVLAAASGALWALVHHCERAKVALRAAAPAPALERASHRAAAGYAAGVPSPSLQRAAKHLGMVQLLLQAQP